MGRETREEKENYALNRPLSFEADWIISANIPFVTG
jgi:hypothetical protein